MSKATRRMALLISTALYGVNATAASAPLITSQISGTYAVESFSECLQTPPDTLYTHTFQSGIPQVLAKGATVPSVSTAHISMPSFKIIPATNANPGVITGTQGSVVVHFPVNNNNGQDWLVVQRRSRTMTATFVPEAPNTITLTSESITDIAPDGTTPINILTKSFAGVFQTHDGGATFRAIVRVTDPPVIYTVTAGTQTFSLVCTINTFGTRIGP
jgi:hypothetical protein